MLYSHVKQSAHVQLHMALHVVVFLFFFFSLHNRLVRIIEGLLYMYTVVNTVPRTYVLMFFTCMGEYRRIKR